MRKLVLKCSYAPGDIVMMTAAVRDLHRCYPGQFQTDVRTHCPDLWEHNPFITPLAGDDPDAETLECTYPLINHSNRRPYHCLHGFISFLNDQLKLNIRPTDFRGDIHLSKAEKSWHSQVCEITGEDTPFWIVAAGGKFDITIKWWQTGRYQQVIDRFADRLLFVQVGQLGHYHPRLEGALDLRGRTTLRELIRLVYHADGVLCGVTALMHLAAAVPLKHPTAVARPCVVVAGGREPAHWEAYPNHQFIHTNGALPCCEEGGCWKDRTERLYDGAAQDRPGRLCVDVRNGLPHCMEMITADDVVRRIETYYQGGHRSYLSSRQRAGARRGVAVTRSSPFDDEPLNLHTAHEACEDFIRKLAAPPPAGEGRGIVICAGGARLFVNAWVCINLLRHLGCRLPVQVWHLGAGEMDGAMAALLRPLEVEMVDAYKVRRRHPVRRLGGWELKPYALLHCPFAEALLLDADNTPVANPEYLFDARPFEDFGAVFWPDYDRRSKAHPIWRNCRLRRPREPEFESGQILVDKRRCGRALRLALWFNEHSDFYYRYFHGDKDTFHLAFRKLRTPYYLVKRRITPLPGTMCQHDVRGRRVFQHRNTDKWDFLAGNRRVPGFIHEALCRRFLDELRARWSGLPAAVADRVNRPGRSVAGSLRLCAVMISCRERERQLEKTLQRLAATDWDLHSLRVQMDPETGADHRARQTRNALQALKTARALGAHYTLFLEDDLDFNRHLRHNLTCWQPLRQGRVTLASLYNPGLAECGYDLANHAYLVEPGAVYGSQAFLLSREAVEHCIRQWGRMEGMQDIRLSRLAGRLGRPCWYHHPSLVEHRGARSVWGGFFHQARDFDRDWKAGFCSKSNFTTRHSPILSPRQ